MPPKKQTTITQVVTITTIQTETTNVPNGTCYRCGRRGHYSTTCYAKTDTDGNSLDDEEFECSSCDLTFSTKFGCMVHQRSCN